MKTSNVVFARFSLACVAIAFIVASRTPVVLSQEPIVQKALPLDMALKIAEGALQRCRADGARVSVTVVDATGLPKVLIRDDESGLHTLDLSQRKAYTAFTYRRTSAEQARYWASLPPPTFEVQGTVALPGGVPIRAGNQVIGAIGVSGSPEPPPGKDQGVLTGTADERCAQAGIDKVTDRLK